MSEEKNIYLMPDEKGVWHEVEAIFWEEGKEIEAINKAFNMGIKEGRVDAIDECISVIDTWREDYIKHKEQNPINYGLILDFKRWMHGLKEQKNED